MAKRCEKRDHSVEDWRSEDFELTATGVVDTVTECNSTVGKVTGVTWADVVRRPAVTSNVKMATAVSSKGTSGIGKRTKSMNVLQRSFSQNNPVNRIKV